MGENNPEYAIMTLLSGFGGDAKFGSALVEDGKYCLEEDVTIDREPDASIALYTTEAGCEAVSALYRRRKIIEGTHCFRTRARS